MADDIDDLLDEFDDLLDKSRSSIKPKQKSSSKTISSSKKVTRNEDKNLKRLAVTLRTFQSFSRYSDAILFYVHWDGIHWFFFLSVKRYAF